jgi:hypothetical protein
MNSSFTNHKEQILDSQKNKHDESICKSKSKQNHKRNSTKQSIKSGQRIGQETKQIKHKNTNAHNFIFYAIQSQKRQTFASHL